MLKTLSFALLIVVCLSVRPALSQNTSIQRSPLLTFNDLAQSDSTQGTFRIKGYVIDIYECPPCPPGAMCKPCLPNNIVVTDNIEEKDLSKIRRLRIYTEKPEQFELKKQYLFTVKVKGTLPPGRAITDLELISFEVVKGD